MQILSGTPWWQIKMGKYSLKKSLMVLTICDILDMKRILWSVRINTELSSAQLVAPSFISTAFRGSDLKWSCHYTFKIIFPFLPCPWFSNQYPLGLSRAQILVADNDKNRQKLKEHAFPSVLPRQSVPGIRHCWPSWRLRLVEDEKQDPCFPLWLQGPQLAALPS